MTSPRAARKVTAGRSSPRRTGLRAMWARCDPAIDVEPPVGFVDRRQADADGQSGAVQRVATPLAVLVPGQADEAVDRAHPFDQPLGRDLAEVLAERVARLVPVVEEPPIDRNRSGRPAADAGARTWSRSPGCGTG